MPPAGVVPSYSGPSRPQYDPYESDDELPSYARSRTDQWAPGQSYEPVPYTSRAAAPPLLTGYGYSPTPFSIYGEDNAVRSLTQEVQLCLSELRSRLTPNDYCDPYEHARLPGRVVPGALFPTAVGMLQECSGEEHGFVYQGIKVDYMDEHRRNDFKLKIDPDGTVRDKYGVFDSSPAVPSRLGDKPGHALCVMDHDGNFYAAVVGVPGLFHHSSFFAGRSVVFAGTLEVRGGRLISVTSSSGHYRCNKAMAAQALAMLEAQIPYTFSSDAY